MLDQLLNGINLLLKEFIFFERINIFLSEDFLLLPLFFSEFKRPLLIIQLLPKFVKKKQFLFCILLESEKALFESDFFVAMQFLMPFTICSFLYEFSETFSEIALVVHILFGICLLLLYKRGLLFFFHFRFHLHFLRFHLSYSFLDIFECLFLSCHLNSKFMALTVNLFGDCHPNFIMSRLYIRK